ncbi:MAG: hypothetical protein QG603_831 [Patescibacteria group bacterium]|nr:hypothetical protein [Patescibacteria group bacterium]MDQ5971054.1 hypothetical protein [Patescibacteria group bacterium]
MKNQKVKSISKVKITNQTKTLLATSMMLVAGLGIYFAFALSMPNNTQKSTIKQLNTDNQLTKVTSIDNKNPLIAEQLGYDKKINSLGESVFYPDHAEGWPVFTGDHMFVQPPSIADINNDGQKELVATNESGTYAWQKNGRIIEGWPYLTTPWNNYFAPALADTNNDNNLEIFGGGSATSIFGLNNEGALLNGWPYPIYYSADHSSIAYDINRDGKIEIIGGQRWPGQKGGVYVWDANGVLLPGWPKEITESDHINSLAIGDINGDGGYEIIATGGWKIYIWDAAGNSLGNWPRTLEPWSQTFPGHPGTYYNNPLSLVVGDINNDGQNDLVTFTYNYAYDNNLKRIWVHAVNIKGQELPGFPVEIPNLYGYFRPGLTLADLNKDGKLEIIVPTLTKLLIVHNDGSFKFLPDDLIPGAAYIGFRGSVVADINNDNEMEILSPIYMDNDTWQNGNEWGTIYAWNADRKIVDGFPIELPWTPTSGLSIEDLDGDGKIEISGGFAEYNEIGRVSRAGTYVLNLPGTYDAKKVEWGTFAHDIKNTNNYRLKKTTIIDTDFVPTTQ